MGRNAWNLLNTVLMLFGLAASDSTPLAPKTIKLFLDSIQLTVITKTFHHTHRPIASMLDGWMQPD